MIITTIQVLRKYLRPILPTKILTIAALSSFSLSACQYFVEDKPKAAEPFKLEGADQCLESALPVIQDFYSGKSNADEVGQAWDCAANALDMFMSHTRGREISAYSAQELRSFLETYFLGDVKISDGLLEEIMRFKQALLGGESYRLSRDELVRARDVMMTLKQESIRLLPYMRVVTMNADTKTAQADPKQVEEAIAELSRSFNVLGGLLGQSQAPYELKNIERLLRELQAIYTSETGWDGPAWVVEHLPALAAAKAFLIKPNGETIAPDEWRSLFDRAGELYGLYLRAHYLLSDRDLLSGEGLDQLEAAIKHTFSIVDRILESKPDHLIAYDVIDPVVNEAVRLKLIDWDIKAATLRSAVRSVLERVANPPSASSKDGLKTRKQVGGLQPENFAEFKEGIFGWFEQQKVWRRLLAEAVRRDPSLAGKAIPIKMVREIWPTLATSYPDQQKDIAYVLAQKYPVTYTQTGTVIFERAQQLLAIDQDSFNSLNWKQSFIRGVINGYSYDPVESRYTGLTKAEFKDFFEDVKGLGVDLGFLDPNDKTIWSSVFEEINMFALSGDAYDSKGAKRLSFSEGVDFISYALSASKMSRKTYADLKANCKHYENDIFGIPKVEAQCYRKRFRASFADNYQYLPRWVKMTSRFSGEEWADFQREIEMAARKKGYSDELIESTDVDRGSMVFQYIESMFVRFDADKSGDLDWSEAQRGFPVLRGPLAEASGLDDDQLLEALFAYLLKYGEPPASFTDKVWFRFFWARNFIFWEKNKWDLKADRRQVLRIIANLNKPAS